MGTLSASQDSVPLGRGFQPDTKIRRADGHCQSFALENNARRRCWNHRPDHQSRSRAVPRRWRGPSRIQFPRGGEQVQVWTTLAIDARSATVQPVTQQRGARMLSVMGRLRDGVSIQQAGAQMNRIAGSLANGTPTKIGGIRVRFYSPRWATGGRRARSAAVPARRCGPCCSCWRALIWQTSC